MADRYQGQEGLELAHRILAVMGRHDVAPNPRNYAIWAAYVTGSHPALAHVMDDLVKSGGPFTGDVAERLHGDYLSDSEPSPRVIDASSRMAESMGAAHQSLVDAGVMTKAYGDALQDASGQLETADGDNLQQVIAGLMDETNKMRARTSELEDRLGAATSEVNSLRDELETARQASLTDPLTGLANRKQMDKRLDAMAQEAKDGPAPACVVLADIDHFKRVNDTWGHPTGDQIIRFVARTLRRLAGETDVVARYGGEEFAVLLPGVSLADAVSYAEEARQAVQQKQLLRKSTNENLGNVTISLGVAQVSDADTPQSVLERADQRLYVSKRTGRNRVTADEPDQFRRGGAAPAAA